MPKNSFRGTAVPSDVRKASGLPASSILNFGLRPGFGAQPQIRRANRRKRGALPHIRRHSRIRWLNFFRQTPETLLLVGFLASAQTQVGALRHEVQARCPRFQQKDRRGMKPRRSASKGKSLCQAYSGTSTSIMSTTSPSPVAGTVVWVVGVGISTPPTISGNSSSSRSRT